MSAEQVRSERVKERVPFLVESSRAASEELQFRIQHRDHWLKLQLLAQVTLLALAFGVEIGGVAYGGGVSEGFALPGALALAFPISFVFAALYGVEDLLVSALSKFRGTLPRREAQLFQEEGLIDVFESSIELREFPRLALFIRGVAQSVAFLLIPSGFTWYRLWNALSVDDILWSSFIVGVVLDGFLFVAVVIILILSFRRRMLAGTVERS